LAIIIITDRLDPFRRFFLLQQAHYPCGGILPGRAGGQCGGRDTTSGGILCGQRLLRLGVVIVFSIFSLWQVPHAYAIAIYRSDNYTAAALPLRLLERGMRSARKQIAGYIVVAFVTATVMFTASEYTGMVYLVVVVILNAGWLPPSRVTHPGRPAPGAATAVRFLQPDHHRAERHDVYRRRTIRPTSPAADIFLLGPDPYLLRWPSAGNEAVPSAHRKYTFHPIFCRPSLSHYQPSYLCYCLPGMVFRGRNRPLSIPKH